ncbi:MAG: hypothetical protein KDA61_13685, partial [Planctomycetales bacterium]|nr:hypothetical protein [Planctomycetales bacterium]
MSRNSFILRHVLCASLLAQQCLLTGCSEGVLPTAASLTSESPLPADGLASDASPPDLSELLRALQALETAVPSEDAANEASNEEVAPAADSEVSETASSDATPVTIDSWAMFAELFLKRTGVSWSEFVKQSTEAASEIDAARASLPEPPSLEDADQLLADLQAVHAENEQFHHLSQDQANALQKALDDAAAFRQQAEASVQATHDASRQVDEIVASLRRKIDNAVASVDELRRRPMTAEEASAVCGELLDPTGAVAIAIQAVVDHRGQLEAVVQGLQVLGETLDAEAQRLRDTIDELSRKIDHPLIERAKEKADRTAEAIKKFVTASSIAVAAMIHPLLGWVALLAHLIFGGGGGKGGGGHGGSGETQGQTEGDDGAQEAGSETGKSPDGSDD